MKTKEYDFSKGKRGSAIPHPGKTRITIWIDNSTLDWFKDKAEREGRGYQTDINEALKTYTRQDPRPIQEIIKEAVMEGMKAARKTG
ncbi:MAG: BrnA antitoxin family protein [Nitrospinota bacterium]|nr:BrnA antitoxin family protein [Nitrospinota bacterium]